MGKKVSKKSSKTEPIMFRQGDVLIRQISSLPELKAETEVLNGDLVLAEGETTGHAHRIRRSGNMKFWNVDTGKGENPITAYMTLGEAATVTHEEHNAIDLPSGNYEIRIKREYHPEEYRRVHD